MRPRPGGVAVGVVLGPCPRAAEGEARPPGGGVIASAAPNLHVNTAFRPGGATLGERCGPRRTGADPVTVLRTGVDAVADPAGPRRCTRTEYRPARRHPTAGPDRSTSGSFMDSPSFKPRTREQDAVRSGWWPSSVWGAGDVVGLASTVTTLYVAAGGGGDALASVILDRASGRRDAERAVIATYAWDRLLVDPTPRSPWSRIVHRPAAGGSTDLPGRGKLAADRSG